MRILYLVERATQFEAPFFQYVKKHHGRDKLRVLFLAQEPGAPVFDPELRFKVNWGIDLLGDYDQRTIPAVPDWLDELAADFKQRRWQLVITNGHKAREYRQVRALARQHEIPVALRLDADATGSSRPVLFAKRRFYRRFLARRYDLFLGVGKRTTDFLESCGIDAKRRASFPYAVDLEHFRAGCERFLDCGTSSDDQRAAHRELFGVPPDVKLVLAVAKFSPREVPEDLVRAMTYLDRDVWLLVAGEGEKRGKLEELAKAVPPDRLQRERVKLPGYVRYTDLPALYAIADVFVHAAREEHWGVSVAEALACGLPAIASSGVGAGRDLIRDGRNGYGYRAGDAHELADRIREALSLSPDHVKAANREVLASVSYSAAWEDLCAAARQAQAMMAEQKRAKQERSRQKRAKQGHARRRR